MRNLTFLIAIAFQILTVKAQELKNLIIKKFNVKLILAFFIHVTLKLHFMLIKEHMQYVFLFFK